MAQNESIKRLTVDIPESLHKKLKIGAIHREVSMNELIRQLIEDELRNDKKKAAKTKRK